MLWFLSWSPCWLTGLPSYLWASFSCSGNILRGHDQFLNLRRSSFEVVQYEERDSLQEIVSELESFTRKLPENLDEHNIYVKQACEVTEQPSENGSNCALPGKLVVNEDAFKTFNRWHILEMWKYNNLIEFTYLKGYVNVGSFQIIHW